MKRKKDKKKNSKRRLLLLLLLLVFTISLGSLATYAWFTSNTTVDVDPMTVNVRATNGLEISATAELTSWKARVTATDLKNATRDGYAVNMIPSVLKNASSAGDVENGDMNMFLGTTVINAAGDGYLISTVKSTEDSCYLDDCEAYYVVYDLYFKLESEDGGAKPVYLTSASAVNASGADLGIKNTARVAFVVQGTLPLDDYYNDSYEVEGVTYPGYEYVRTLKNGTSATIWEPNALADHKSNAVLNARNNYNIDLSLYNSTAVPYYGATQACSNIALNAFYTDKTAGGCFKLVSPVTSLGSGYQLMTLSPGVTKVRVYFWVEGNDVDAENTATGSGMELNLQFSL